MNTFSPLHPTPRRTRRAEQRDATSSSVLEAARAEFESAGYEGANLRAIAARAGVSAGTVLHHYADKRELLHAVLFDSLNDTLTEALAKPGPAPLEAQLSRLGKRVLKSYQQRPELSRVLLRESLFAQGAWAKRFSAQTAAVHAALAGWVAKAVERRELKKTADGRVLAAAWLAFFYFGLIGWVQGAHPKPEQLIDALTRQHLEGLR